MKRYTYRTGAERSVMIILGLAIVLLATLVFTTLSGFLVYQPQTIQLEVNKVVPTTAYLEVDGKNWPLPEGLPAVDGGYRIDSLTINPSDYSLGQGWHTINIMDLITKQKLFSAELDVTGNLVSVKG